MERCSILHLALLRKIKPRSSNEKKSPSFKYHRRLDSYNSNHTPQTSHTSRQLSQNTYLSSQMLNFVRKKTNTFEPKDQIKNQTIEDSFILNGWSNQKDYEYGYDKLIKSSRFRHNHNQPQPLKKIQEIKEKSPIQRNFNFFSQDFKQFFKGVNLFNRKINIKGSTSKKSKISKLKNLIIEGSLKQQHQSQQKTSFYFDKENQFSQSFNLSQLPGIKKRLNKKSKTQKITELVKQFNQQFNLKRI